MLVQDGMSAGLPVSCLKSRGGLVLALGDTELAEHSEEEWYPPTPPLYDVTDRLRSVGSQHLFNKFPQKNGPQSTVLVPNS